MNALRILLASLGLAALAACPGAAPAASLVPPGNSAANQYTETFPTTGGDAEAKGKGRVTPGDVLGAGNARKLDSQGKQGREAAAVVAATAPAAIGGGSRESSGVAPAGGDDGGDSTGGGKDGGAKEGAAAGEAASVPDPDPAAAADSSGSSGVGEVLGQATGSTSSGGTGLLLPLVVLASVVWALAFFLRRKRRTA